MHPKLELKPPYTEDDFMRKQAHSVPEKIGDFTLALIASPICP